MTKNFDKTIRSASEAVIGVETNIIYFALPKAIK